MGDVLHASDIHSAEEPLGLKNGRGEIHGGKVCVTQVSCNPAATGDRGFLRLCDGRKMQMK